METEQEELIRLRELVLTQSLLLDGYSEFMASMPFSTGDVIQGYQSLVDRIEVLSEPRVSIQEPE